MTIQPTYEHGFDALLLHQFLHNICMAKKRTRLFFGFKIAALDVQKLLDYTNSLDSYASNKKTA